MTPKERVEAAFKKQPTDKVPVNHRGFSSKAASHILKREAFIGGGIQKWREVKSLYEGWHDEYLERSFKDAVDLARITGQDLVRPQYWRAPRKPTRKIDDNTYLFENSSDENTWRVLKYDPGTEQSYDGWYRPRVLTSDEVRRNVDANLKTVNAYTPKDESQEFALKAQKLLGNNYAIELSCATVLPSVHTEIIWLELMLLDPGLVKEYISIQLTRVKRNVEHFAKHGFRYFLGGHDFATDTGTFYSPQLFNELMLPALKQVSDCCCANNGYHIFASDGNLWPVADMLFEKAGVHGYYEIDRHAGMRVEDLRVKHPNLTCLGNISSWTLSQGSKEDVITETRVCIDAAKKYNGIILGVSNQVLCDTPSENIDALLETIENYR
ncbi:MAG: uroporphyrinogen decarboxylase family protein [Elusimicrobiota bacterium]